MNSLLSKDAAAIHLHLVLLALPHLSDDCLTHSLEGFVLGPEDAAKGVLSAQVEEGHQAGTADARVRRGRELVRVGAEGGSARRVQTPGVSLRRRYLVARLGRVVVALECV